ALDAVRPELEADLIAPLVGETTGVDAAAYIAAMLADIRGAGENPFTAWLATTDHRDDHYRNFLVQSSPDLLAEASASALGIVGEFGEPQSALFRILIDEFGYGSYPKKHSILYRAAMRGFGLDDEYNGYWPLWDTEALRLHNVIHWLFQNPRNLFRQIGFLLYAEAAYQRSTQAHYRHLTRFNPDVDARYFGEHAHIDLHHSRMIIDEVVGPLVAKFGEAVGAEVIVGAELTRTTFARAGEHLLAVSQALEAIDGVAWGLVGDARNPLGRPVTPSSDLGGLGGARVQVGAIGVLQDARDLARFPPATIGRVLA
ncbi:MAG: iron-containing redox enzyme family protein, partial [Phenylobacterium sp.]